MVTFRRIIIIEDLHLEVIIIEDLHSEVIMKGQNFLIMIIFEEVSQVEIIITQSKLIEKYNDLAREALANEDKILSENYFQHADHFTRVQNEQESIRMARVNSSSTATVKAVEVDVKDEKPTKTSCCYNNYFRASQIKKLSKN